jgi:hypothetical protein
VRLGEIRSNRKAWIFGLCAVVALAAAGAALGFTVLGGSSVAALPTTGQFAPLTWQHPLTPQDFIPNPLAPPRIDPDSMVRAGVDLQTVLSPLGGNRYRLMVSNVSGIGFIDTFHWLPPGGMLLDKVTSSTSGDCSVTGTSGYGGNLFQKVLLNPEISCSGANLKPPTCTCSGDGGHLTVYFTVQEGSYKGLMSGAARVDTATPVLKIIPSSTQSPDLKECAKGETNTKADPCAPTGNG